MKPLKTVLLLLLLAWCAAAQNTKPAPPNFDNADFTKKFEIVEWLVEYDNVAWKTTDVVVAQATREERDRMGGEWFCFKDKNKVWHAVYGRLNEDKYDAVLHFEMDSAQKIKRSTEKIDQAFLDGHARALRTAHEKLSAHTPPGSPRFNQFIRQNADKTFSVWMMPAFQPDRMAPYGGEGIYTVDSSGTKILKDDSYFQVSFRGFKVDPTREVLLEYSELEKPSLGAIFFVWYYKTYFARVVIVTENTMSSVMKTPAGYIWLHVVNENAAPLK